MKKSYFFVLLAIITVSAITAAVFFQLGRKQYSPSSPTSPTPTSTTQPAACTQEAKLCPDGSAVGRTGPNCEFAPCPLTTVTPVPTTKPGWTTYKNTELGFEISFPDKYKTTDDSYGWPKSVLLLYSGGQSYDLAIEVWNSTAEYQAKYPAGTKNITVKNIDGKYLTLLNMNFKPEVDEIIATFKNL